MAADRRFLFILAAILGTGCASERALLKSPGEELSALRLNEKISGSDNFNYITLGRRSAREISGHGLLGLTIGSIAAGASRGGSAEVVSALGNSCDVGQLLQVAIQNLLVQHGRLDNSAAGSPMELRLEKYGLLEEQPGYFVPYAWASASVRNASGERIWSATAYSQSTKARSRDDYISQPKNYAEDFKTVSEDLARQLVEGPIRTVPRRY